MVNRKLNKETIWITWERQRRTVEIAKELGIKLCIYSSDIKDGLPFYLRYPYLGTITLLKLIQDKPRILFIQNPSMVLAAIACLFKNVIGYKLIIDRHSNFKIEKSGALKWKLFHFLSKYTTKKAELTIVTNEFLKNIVNRWGGKGYILQDKLPVLDDYHAAKLKGEKNIVVISSFHSDEPIKEIIDAAAQMIDKKSINIYITGRATKSTLHENIPNNLTFTGYLPDDEYQTLLYSADLVVVLTKQNYTLTCGAYEAISLTKPMVLSETESIMEYFNKGAVYCKPEANSIKGAIEECLSKIDKFKEEVRLLKDELIISWKIKFDELVDIINSI